MRTNFLSISIVVLFWGLSMSYAQPTNNPRPEFWVTDGTVNAIVESCGTLYVGGSFANVGPQTGECTRLDIINGSADPSFPRLEGTSVDVITPDGAGGWYVGGDFATVNSLPIQRLAHIRADNSIDTGWSPNPNAQVLAIAVANNTVYVGGFFNGASSIAGQSRNRLAAFDATTGQLLPWNPSVSSAGASAVRSIVPFGNTIYIGGSFTGVDGTPRNRIAALDATAISSPYVKPWDPNSGGIVRAMVLSGTTLYVGGEFTTAGTIGGAIRNRLAALSTTLNTNNATSWNPNAGGIVRSLALSGGTVYVGGDFQTIDGQQRNRLAAIDPAATVSGTYLRFWNPNANAAVNSLVVSNDTVYAGGNFTIVDGSARNRIAALERSATTSPYVTAWDPNAGNSVNAIGLSASSVCVGGIFSSIGRIGRKNIVALDTTTGLATPWNPGADSDVLSLAVSGGIVFVGGKFVNIGGLPRNRIAALDHDGNAVSTWDPNANNWVESLYATPGTIYVGGDFSGANSIGSANRNRVAALDAVTGLADPSWNPNADNTVNALAVSGSRVYAGGQFASIGGQSRNWLAAIDNTGSADPTWNAGASNGSSSGAVHALILSGSTLYVGGSFSSIGGSLRGNIAALDVSSASATPWNPNMNLGVSSLGLASNLILAGGDFTLVGGQPRQYLAAVDNNGSLVAWNPNPNSSAGALASAVGTVYAGGNFTAIGSQQRKSLAAFSVVNTDWVGTTGAWNIAGNWSGGVIPNNTSCEFFNVHVGDLSSNVTLDLDPTINSLTVDTGATVQINQGDLTIATADGVTNNANLTISNGHSLIARAPMTLAGSSSVQMTNGGLDSASATSVIVLTTPVHGTGTISAAFVNQSTIEADVGGQILSISGPFPASSNGPLRATSAGMLLVSRSIVTSGILDADGGTIGIAGAGVNVVGPLLNVQDGGKGQIDSGASAYFGHVALSCGHFRGCNPPVLSCTAGPGPIEGLHVSGDIQIEDPTSVSVVSSASVSVSGDFVNHSMSPLLFHWEEGPLVLDGSAPQSFELAGKDYGDSNPLGFVDNFAMGFLRIEPGRDVSFINTFDNSPGTGCEVLYVETLSLGAGCTIHSNGCNIYYRHKIQESGVTLDLHGGALKSALIGDMNCDSSVSGIDIAAFIRAMVDPVGFSQAYPGCDILHGDLDNNGIVDLNDLGPFLNLLLAS